MKRKTLSWRDVLRAAAEHVRQYEDLAGAGDRRLAFGTIVDDLLDLSLKQPSYRALDRLHRLLLDSNRRALDNPEREASRVWSSKERA